MMDSLSQHVLAGLTLVVASVAAMKMPDINGIVHGSFIVEFEHAGVSHVSAQHELLDHSTDSMLGRLLYPS